MTKVLIDECLSHQVLEVTLDDDKAAIDLIRYEMPSREDS
jgi:hypothetical protein